MREMFYSTQPMEKPDDPAIREATFRMINAGARLVWSSDYPHLDFDPPSVIYDLPFLRGGQAQHPRRQCGAFVRARSKGGEDDSVSGVPRLAVPP
jgi:hypothetical protein